MRPPHSPLPAAVGCIAGCRARVSLLHGPTSGRKIWLLTFSAMLRAAGGSSKALQRPRMPTPKFLRRRKKPAPALGTPNHSAPCRRSCFGETAAQRLGSCLGAGVAAPPAAAPPAILTSAEVTLPVTFKGPRTEGERQVWSPSPALLSCCGSATVALCYPSAQLWRQKPSEPMVCWQRRGGAGVPCEQTAER